MSDKRRVRSPEKELNKDETTKKKSRKTNASTNNERERNNNATMVAQPTSGTVESQTKPQKTEGASMQRFQSRNLDKLANFDWYLKNHPFVLRCHSTGRDLEDFQGVLVSEQSNPGNKRQRWRYKQQAIINEGTQRVITLVGDDESNLGVKMKKHKPKNIDQQWLIMSSGFIAKKGIPSLNLQCGIPGDDLPFHMGVSFRHASGGGAQKQIFDTVLLFPKGTLMPSALPPNMKAMETVRESVEEQALKEEEQPIEEEQPLEEEAPLEEEPLIAEEEPLVEIPLEEALPLEEAEPIVAEEAVVDNEALEVDDEAMQGDNEALQGDNEALQEDGNEEALQQDDAADYGNSEALMSEPAALTSAAPGTAGTGTNGPGFVGMAGAGVNDDDDDEEKDAEEEDLEKENDGSEENGDEMEDQEALKDEVDAENQRNEDGNTESLSKEEDGFQNLESKEGEMDQALETDDTNALMTDDTNALQADDTTALQADDTNALMTDDTNALQADDTNALMKDDANSLREDKFGSEDLDALEKDNSGGFEDDSDAFDKSPIGTPYASEGNADLDGMDYDTFGEDRGLSKGEDIVGLDEDDLEKADTDANGADEDAVKDTEDTDNLFRENTDALEKENTDVLGANDETSSLTKDMDEANSVEDTDALTKDYAEDTDPLTKDNSEDTGALTNEMDEGDITEDTSTLTKENKVDTGALTKDMDEENIAEDTDAFTKDNTDAFGGNDTDALGTDAGPIGTDNQEGWRWTRDDQETSPLTKDVDAPNNAEDTDTLTKDYAEDTDPLIKDNTEDTGALTKDIDEGNIAEDTDAFTKDKRSEDDLAVLTNDDDSLEELQQSRNSVREDEISDKSGSQVVAANGVPRSSGESGFEGYEAIGGDCGCPGMDGGRDKDATAAAAALGTAAASEEEKAKNLDDDSKEEDGVDQQLVRSQSPIGTPYASEGNADDLGGMGYDTFGEDRGLSEGEVVLKGGEIVRMENTSENDIIDVENDSERNSLILKNSSTPPKLEGVGTEEAPVAESPDTLPLDSSFVSDDGESADAIDDGASIAGATLSSDGISNKGAFLGSEMAAHEEGDLSVMQKDALLNADAEDGGAMNDDSSALIFDDDATNFDGEVGTKIEGSGSDGSGFEGYVKIGGECKCSKNGKLRRAILASPKPDELPKRKMSLSAPTPSDLLEEQKNNNSLLLDGYSALSIELSKTDLETAVREVLLQRLQTVEDLGGDFDFSVDAIFPTQCLKALVDFVDVERAEDEGQETEEENCLVEDRVVESEAERGTIEVLPLKLRSFSGYADAESVDAPAVEVSASEDTEKTKGMTGAGRQRYEFCASKTDFTNASDMAACEKIFPSTDLLEKVATSGDTKQPSIRAEASAMTAGAAVAVIEEIKPSEELREVVHAVKDSPEMMNLTVLIAHQEAEEEVEAESLNATEDVKPSAELVEKIVHRAVAIPPSIESKQMHKPLLKNLLTDSHVDSINKKIALFESLEVKMLSNDQQQQQQDSFSDAKAIGVITERAEANEMSVGSGKLRRKPNQLGSFEEERDEVDQVLPRASEDVREVEAESRQFEICPAKIVSEKSVEVSNVVDAVLPVAELKEKADNAKSPTSEDWQHLRGRGFQSTPCSGQADVASGSTRPTPEVVGQVLEDRRVPLESLDRVETLQMRSSAMKNLDDLDVVKPLRISDKFRLLAEAEARARSRHWDEKSGAGTRRESERLPQQEQQPPLQQQQQRTSPDPTPPISTKKQSNAAAAPSDQKPPSKPNKRASNGNSNSWIDANWSLLVVGGITAAAGALYVYTRPSVNCGAAAEVCCGGEEAAASAGRQSWRGGKPEMGLGERRGSGTRILKEKRL